MVLTFGTSQMHTSERMRSNPKLGRLFNKIFGYTNVGNYARFTIFKKLINKLPAEDFGKILDLGTGYGEYAISLANALPEANVHALDIDAERIATVNHALEAQSIKNVKTHLSFVEEIEEKDFDFIFSVDVFEHIAPEEMPFKTAFQKLKPGGHFLVKIPNVTQKTIFPDRYFEDHHDWLEDEHIGQVYDLAGLARRFAKEGFEIVHSSYSDGWLSRLAWELAYVAKKGGVIPQLISLPIAKALIHLDRLVHRNNWGNAIQVIGRKPLES